MRIYGYRYRKKEKRKTGRTMVCAALGLAAVFFVWSGNDTLAGRVSAELKAACYQKIQQLYVPETIYQSAGSQETVLEQLVAHFFPLGDYTTSAMMSDAVYQTQVESELSYEIILAREAADENYIDAETGKLVTAGSTPEETGTGSGTGEDTDSGVEQEAGENVTAEGSDGENSGGENMDGEVAAETEDSAQTVAVAGLNTTGKVVDYPLEKLNDYDYLIQNFYQVDSTTTITSSQLNAEEMLAKDMTLQHDASTPQILIYHTHAQEGFVDSVEGDLSTTVVGVGDYLTEILTEQYGLNVIHHTGVYDTVRDNAYSTAAPALEQILAENPSIEVVIDLHRDGVGENTRLVTTQNGVEMAKIMFFNGLSRTTSMGDIAYLANPYIQDNLALSFQMQLTAAEYYPDLTRKVYLKGYRYNMHYCPKSLLIEVGAQTNTLQEAKNAMVPLADILNKVLTGEE